MTKPISQSIRTLAVAAALLGAMAAHDASAALITSFESPTQGDGTFSLGTTNFTMSGAAFSLTENPSGRYPGDTDTSPPDLPAPGDARQVTRIISNSGNSNGTLTSTGGLGLGLFNSAMYYTLTVAIGNPFSNTTQFNGAIIELLAGPTVIATATLNSVSAQSFADLTANSNGLGTNGSQLSIRLSTNSQATVTDPSSATDFDNVRLTSVVPEPASLGLLALAGVAMLPRRRR